MNHNIFYKNLIDDCISLFWNIVQSRDVKKFVIIWDHTSVKINRVMKEWTTNIPLS